MDKKLRQAQKDILEVFSKAKAKGFALAGGTALELYYLNHRFSADLDFFSPKYNTREIEALAAAFTKEAHGALKLEAESVAGRHARVRIYTLSVKGSIRPLKIDFVEDVLIERPKIRNIDNVRVYAPEDLYLHKTAAICGMQPVIDEVGRVTSVGRREARDVFDLYMLSKKVQPLHLFLLGVSAHFQRGMIHWYRAFSRQELKLGLMDLEIYDAAFDARAMVIYLENEIQRFIREVAGE